MFKPLFRFAAITGAAALLAACIPEFANPLVGGDGADPSIVGTWSGKGDGGGSEEAMPIVITAEGGKVTVVLKDPSGGPTGEEMKFEGTTAELDGVRYINLRPVGEDVPPEYGSMIYKYEIKGDAIHCWGLDNKKIADAVTAGKLKGTTTGSGADATPKVSASSEELAAFFASEEGKAAFSSGAGDTLILTRATP